MSSPPLQPEAHDAAHTDSPPQQQNQEMDVEKEFPHPVSSPAPESSDTATAAASAAAPAPSQDTAADELLTRLTPFLSEQHLEIEARLCNFSAPELPESSSTTDNAPQVLRGGYGRITVGVSAQDFTRMRAHIEAEKQLTMHHSTTKDINTDGGRFTYAVAADGTETFVGCIEKRRLCNIEVAVPNCPYDIRLSVSTEVPRATVAAPAEQPRGFVRVKQRMTATEESYEYAFTSVGGPGGHNSHHNDRSRTTFEVEIEGVHANAQTGVTKAWLAGLLDRLLAMARLEGNTGLPKNTFSRARPPAKRPRPE